MHIAFARLALPKSGALVLLGFEGQPLSAQGASLDKALGGALTRAVKATRFAGKSGQIAEVLAPGQGAFERIVLIGAGAGDKFDAVPARKLGGQLYAKLASCGATQLSVLVETPDGVPEDAVAANLAQGIALRAYRFDRYHTKRTDDDRPTLEKATILTGALAGARKLYAHLSAVQDGVFFTRDLVSEPANILYPAEFARRCKALSELGVTVEVLGLAQLKKLKMGALLGVSQGSARDPQVVVLQWKGGAPKQKPVAFVGKGVTFDSGGISIKPAGGMHEMKWDMGGAGTVAGLFKTLAVRKAKVNAVGVLGIVENMPDGNAQRPGDVVTSMSGQTIEILNTDAEGRLVLADAVWYTQQRFKPRAIIDLATLTGAIIVALGHEMAGLFSDDDKLCDALIAAGKREGELVWRFPLSDAYDRKINSPVADVANIGPAGQAGSVLAAQFIKRFTNGVPWAHLDVAGMVWSNENSALAARGGTGYGVALLDRLVADTFEK